MARIAVLMACHDRREHTLECLRNVHRQALRPGDELDVWLVDDGSSDGTADAVLRDFPHTRVFYGDGSLFWAGGMRKVFAAAMGEGYDFYLWLNDDTHLRDDCIVTLLETYEAEVRNGGKSPVVLGSCVDPDTGEISYGGWLLASQRFPVRSGRVPIAKTAQACDVGNGNCVLIPREVAESVGNIDPAFVHGLGDFDYTLRVRKAGFPLLVAPGVAADCRPHGQLRRAHSLREIRQQWRDFLSVKQTPPAPWVVYTQRHAGPFWVVLFLYPYARFWLRACAQWLLRRR
ncbi:MAG TPA: glycosyltransferase family 2 protein [Gammaproteobacteria bacterium]|nr:glycosyltransferase family 2 protein [Gammaproteobacteria bacterium]